jgi:hypothetical protein
MHNRAGSKVGKKTEILDDHSLPTVCKLRNIIIRPDIPFNWNNSPFNVNNHLLNWLGHQGANYLNIQQQ